MKQYYLFLPSTGTPIKIIDTDGLTEINEHIGTIWPVRPITHPAPPPGMMAGMYIDDEGKLKKEQVVNHYASMVAGFKVVGPAVFYALEESLGKEVGFYAHDIDTWLATLFNL